MDSSQDTVIRISPHHAEITVEQCDEAGVMSRKSLTPETPTYTYPFSNVYGDSRICTGNNALPAYKDPTRIFTIMDYILNMPNNNDMFHAKNNRLGLGYRDLLEHLKDKTPAYYYTDVLIPDGKKLKDFFDRR